MRQDKVSTLHDRGKRPRSHWLAIPRCNKKRKEKREAQRLNLIRIRAKVCEPKQASIIKCHDHLRCSISFFLEHKFKTIMHS